MIQPVNLQIEDNSVVCPKQISDNVFVSNTIISKYKRGKININDDTLPRIKIDSNDLKEMTRKMIEKLNGNFKKTMKIMRENVIRQRLYVEYE